MAVFFFCKKPNNDAKRLANNLGAKILQQFDGMCFWNRDTRIELQEKDSVICWGSHIPEVEGVRVLNAGLSDRTNFETLQLLTAHGFSTLAVADHTIRMEAYRKDGWIPRQTAVTNGLDLLGKATQYDYWVRKVVLSEEYVIHTFMGRSIRAGLKVPMYPVVATAEEWHPGQVHPWVRTTEGGWNIEYGKFKSTAAIRQLAHRTMKTLGLDFGRVTLGQATSGLVVVSVDTRPDITTQASLDIYTRHLQTWLSGDLAKGRAVLPGADYEL